MVGELDPKIIQHFCLFNVLDEAQFHKIEITLTGDGGMTLKCDPWIASFQELNCKNAFLQYTDEKPFKCDLC